MVKTLVKHGNSYALIIDKPILDLLMITPETPLEITTDGTHIFVGPVTDPQQKKLWAAIGKVNKHYGARLRRLADK